MNPFYNPAFLLRIAKSYLSDTNRLWNIDHETLAKYQDKALRRIVKYAYTVPVYHEKYKKAGIHPSDIKGTKDLHKLPFITKNDLRQSYPNGIIPPGSENKSGFWVSTSGSTGKPVFVFIDTFSAIKSLEGFIRAIKAYGGSWKKSKVVLVIDLEPGSIECTLFKQGTLPLLNKFMSLDNIKYLPLDKKPETLIKEINEFNPEFIGSDPNMLRQLAISKNDGLGKDINVKYVFSSGSMLDQYTKDYVEKAFGTRVLDMYGATETGPIAFECVEGDYHIHSDFVKVEFLDEKNNPVSYGQPGHTVFTKLYGEGTPIIRYVGIDDISIPIEKKTSCGFTSEMIKNIEGRASELIYLPNGKTLSPLTLTGVPAKTMQKFNAHVIKQFQIVQHKINEVEVLVVIDEKQKKVKNKDLIDELQKRFSERIGKEVNIRVTKVSEIQKDVRSDYIKVIVSKIKKPT